MRDNIPIVTVKISEVTLNNIYKPLLMLSIRIHTQLSILENLTATILNRNINKTIPTKLTWLSE